MHVVNASKEGEKNVVDLYVGRRLKLLRRQKRISQKDLASRLGITFQQIQKYEKGLNRLPAARMLAICMVLEITPNDLFHKLLSKEYPIKTPIEYTDQEIELIEVMRQLAPNLQQQVHDIVGALAGQSAPVAETKNVPLRVQAV